MQHLPRTTTNSKDNGVDMRLHNTKQMLSILFAVFAFSLLFINSSCEERIIIPDYSVLMAKLNDEELDTDKIIKINKDTLDKNAILSLSAVHYNLDDTINSDATFTFECEGLVLQNAKNSVNILIEDFPSIGTYMIKAKSSIKSTFDCAVIVQVTSSISEINISYTLKSALCPAIVVSDSEKSGVLKEMNNSVTFISNGTYALKITDESGKAINNILLEENDGLISIRSGKNDEYEILINGLDQKKGILKITHSFYKLSFPIYFTIRDASTISIKEEEEKENTDNTPIITLENDENKSYEILLNSFSGDEVLEFSLDAELVDQEKYYTSKDYIPLKNENATWSIMNTITYNYEDEPYFNVSVNGNERKFSITPIKNTVFTLKNGNEENLHTFIYIKYRSDKEARWKYRVLIGGKLEKVTLSLKEGENETALDESNEISVDESTPSGWIFKANFTPENAENKECLWYLAKVNSFKEYRDENGDIFDAPTPFEEGAMGLKSIPLDYTSPYTLGNEDGGLKVYSYSITGNNKISNNSIFVNYTPTSEDVTLACINTKTKLYTFVNIKNRIKNTVTIKGVKLYGSYNTSSNVYNTLSMKNRITVKTENGTENITTPYKQNEKVQAYPNTVDKDNFNIRTFYMGVNSTLTLEIASSIKLSTAALSTDEVGALILTSPTITIDPLDERKATIVIKTGYTPSLSAESYITSRSGLIVKIKLNGDIPIVLRIIVFL